MIVDASVWVSNFVTHDAHHEASYQWLQTQTASGSQLAIPLIALPEVAGAIARRESSPSLGHDAAQWILRISGILIVPVDETLGRRAARIAAMYRLRGADAVYVAAADELGVSLVTWDVELQERAGSFISVIQP